MLATAGGFHWIFPRKCIELIPPDRLHFVLSEMLGHAVAAARHRYGPALSDEGHEESDVSVSKSCGMFEAAVFWSVSWSIAPVSRRLPWLRRHDHSTNTPTPCVHHNSECSGPCRSSATLSSHLRKLCCAARARAWAAQL